MMIYRDCKVQSFFYIAIQHLTGQKNLPLWGRLIAVRRDG